MEAALWVLVQFREHAAAAAASVPQQAVPPTAPSSAWVRCRAAAARAPHSDLARDDAKPYHRGYAKP